ncbi:unnamed protein product [Colias eurytheme]|nr:unnamed protein product [Colias eurytheme]
MSAYMEESKGGSFATSLRSRLPHESDRLPGLPRAHARPDAPERLLPTLQDLEALKKVAQVLVMIGEQVIPSIIGNGSKGTTTTTTEVPQDPVQFN